jgi:hypothetical protein
LNLMERLQYIVRDRCAYQSCGTTSLEWTLRHPSNHESAMIAWSRASLHATLTLRT